jgi:tRNA 2-thiocytidine biosynthesis protein TtcA
VRRKRKHQRKRLPLIPEGGWHPVPKPNLIEKEVNRSVGEALHRYDMIADGDRIVVGISGGKDSLAMLWVLHRRLRRIPIHYTLVPVYLDPGFDTGDAAKQLGMWIGERMGLHLIRETTDYGVVAHSEKNRENPCFLCSRLRRKRLFEIAREHTCSKIALGHNRDDFVETLFLNMFYSGEISTMVPRQPFFGGSFTVIRPMSHTISEKILHLANQQEMPVFQNPCPSVGKSKRRQIREMLRSLYRSNRKIRGNIFRAMHRVNLEYLLDQEPE